MRFRVHPHSTLAAIFVAVSSMLWHPARAQEVDRNTYSLLLRGAPLQQALEELVEAAEIDLVYSSDLVAGKYVFCIRQREDIEKLLHCILENTGLDYIRSSTGTYILIESLQKPPLLGDLAGSIVDLDTGAPLPYANVLLADASAGTTTNQDGLFSFANLMSGLHRLVVTYVGYETSIDSVWVEPGRNNRIRMSLRSREISVGPIVIDGLEQRWPSDLLGSDEAPPRRLARLSNLGTPDVMRGGASRIMGVAVQQPLAGLHIQGGAGNEHVTLLDGVPVRDPVSLGRHLGAFSPLAIQRMTVYKAGFGANQGSHLTGMVAVDHAIEIDQPYRASLMIDPVSLNGRIQSRIPMKGEREMSMMAAYRASTWDVYQDRGVQTLLRHWNTLDPFISTSWAGETVTEATLLQHWQDPVVSFSDLHLASRLRLSPYQTIHASLYRASNRLSTDQRAINDLAPGSPDVFILTNDRYRWLNWAGQARHGWLLGSRSVLSSQVKGSWHHSSYLYKALKEPIEENLSDEIIRATTSLVQDSLDALNGFDENNRIRELSFTSTLSHSFTPDHQAEIGLDVTHVQSRFFLENALVEPFWHEEGAWSLAGFLEDSFHLTTFTRFEPGIRLTYVPSRNTVYAEPRATLRSDGYSEILGSYALRLAGGVYRQFINQFDLTSLGASSAVPSILFWLPVDETMAPQRAYHLAFDARFMPSEPWSFGVETYIKWQPRLLTINYAGLQDIKTSSVHDYDALEQRGFIIATNGRAYGGSLQATHEGERFTHRIAYSLSRASQRFPGRFDDTTQPTPWNIPHRVSFDTEAKLTGALSLDVNWISQWGRSWALRRAYYDFIALRENPPSFDPFDLSDPSRHETPAYHRLDVGLTYRIETGRMTTSVQAFMINAMDRRNVYDLSLEPVASGLQSLPRTLPGRQFSLSLRVDY